MNKVCVTLGPGSPTLAKGSEAHAGRDFGYSALSLGEPRKFPMGPGSQALVTTCKGSKGTGAEKSAAVP